jgi:hypothetical protein
MERWLAANSRVFFLALAPAVVLATAGLVLTVVTHFREAPLANVAGWSLLWCGLAATALIVGRMRLPRLAYLRGWLLVYLSGARPIRIPIDVVECFFLGQGPSQIDAAGIDRVKARNLIVRLAESATQWHQMPVRASLGEWCDGYITVRGMWCEPLTIKLVTDLNRRLAQVKRGTKNN